MLYKVLIIEDDKDLALYLRELLISNTYSVEVANDGASALKYLEKESPNLVILDLGLPDIQGETLCKEIKEFYADLPIIILTAKGGATNIVAGLSLGADDYVAKPFNADELLARIRARLREPGGNVPLIVGDLKLDPKSIEVKRGSKKIPLTQTEFKLLHYLMTNPGQVLTREMILSRVWSYSSDIETRVVDVYMGYLRKKIDAGPEKKLLHSVRGFGYVIKP